LAQIKSLNACLNGISHEDKAMDNRSHEHQAGYLASITQSFDVGDFDYLSPQEMNALNRLIANAWQSLAKHADGDVDTQISAIEQAIHRKQVLT
jgi:hypothetical protein